MKLRFILAGFCLLACCACAFPQQGVRPSPSSLALEMTSRLAPESYEFEELTRTISLSYWKRGDAANALAQVDKLAPEQRLQLLSWLVESAAKDERTDLVRRAVSKALIPITSDETPEAGDVRRLARCAAEIGAVDEALTFAAMLDDGSDDKALALLAVAEAIARDGKEDRAISILDLAIKQFDGFDEEENRYLVDIAVMGSAIFLRLGERERALALVDRANAYLTAQAKPDPTDAANVASLYARLGSTKEVIHFDELQDPRALISLGLAYGERGADSAALSCLTQARQNLDSSDDSGRRSLVEAYIRLGRLDDAINVQAEISDVYHTAEGAVALARVLKAKDRKDDAVAVLDTAFGRVRRIISEKSAEIPINASTSLAQQKSHALLKLGEAYIDLGEARKAEGCAKAIDHPQYRARGLSQSAMAYAKSDQFTAQNLLAKAFKLSRTAEEYSHDADRKNTLYAIAQAYAAVGDKENAANVVHRYLAELWDTEPGQRELITYLFEVGAIVEQEGIELDKKSQVILARIFKRFTDDN